MFIFTFKSSANEWGKASLLSKREFYTPEHWRLREWHWKCDMMKTRMMNLWKVGKHILLFTQGTDFTAGEWRIFLGMTWIAEKRRPVSNGNLGFPMAKFTCIVLFV